MRFDFTYHTNITSDDIKRIEDLVNAKIRENIPVTIEYTAFKEAIDRGVLAFFGEKYNPEKVRIVTIPGFSQELCGGTHVQRTGDIGTFKITEVSSIAAGHRRIVALTGPKAIELFQDTFTVIKNITLTFQVKRENIVEHFEKQMSDMKELQKQIEHIKKEAWRTNITAWLSQIETINGIPFLFLTLANENHESLKEIAQLLQEKKPGFYFLVSPTGTSTLIVATIAQNISTQVDLKKLTAILKEKHHFKGGGSAFTLQGTSTTIDPRLQDTVVTWLKS